MAAMFCLPSGRLSGLSRDYRVGFRIQGRLWAGALTLCVACLCMVDWGWGRSLEDLQQRIYQKQQAQEAVEENVAALSRKERSLHADLQKLQERIAALKQTKQKQQGQVQQVQDTLDSIQVRMDRLHKKQATLQAELQQVLPKLWEASIRSRHIRSQVFRSWTRTDRHVMWLKAITQAVKDKYRQLQQVQAALGQEQKQVRSHQARLQSKQEKLARLKQELTRERLEFVQQVRAVRRKQRQGRAKLQELSASIQRLKSKLQAAHSHEFPALKGSLPWPAQGDLIRTYAPEESGSDGLGLALGQNARIKAISWGEVVYNDKLRGFGQVIIIYHGHEYYSLYAFLSRSLVQVDRKVEKGEVIGRAGFYPHAQGPGLYFELRRKQRPIDPRSWLASPSS